MKLGKYCLGLAFLMSTASCASGMGAVRDTVSSAPEWYQERAQEVRGEGYPSIGRIPTLDPGETSASALETGRESVVTAEDLFRLDARSVPPGLELQDMLQWADKAKSDAAQKAGEDGNHLTDAEVAKLRALFDTVRAQS